MCPFTTESVRNNAKRSTEQTRGLPLDAEANSNFGRWFLKVQERRGVPVGRIRQRSDDSQLRKAKWRKEEEWSRSFSKHDCFLCWSLVSLSFASLRDILLPFASGTHYARKYLWNIKRVAGTFRRERRNTRRPNFCQFLPFERRCHKRWLWSFLTYDIRFRGEKKEKKFTNRYAKYKVRSCLFALHVRPTFARRHLHFRKNVIARLWNSRNYHET